MTRLVAALAVVVTAAALVGCGADGGSNDAPGAAPAEAACDAPAAAPDLLEDLAAVREAVVAEAGLAPAPAYEELVRACDQLGATSAVVPVAWADRVPGPGDVPRAGFTTGPDLESRIEDEPVVWVDAARYPGEPTDVAFANFDNARGTLANGTQTPRQGDAIPNVCRPLEPVVARFGDGALAGEVQPFVECDGEARVWLVAAAYPDDGSRFRTWMIGQALTEADLDALLGVYATFAVDPEHLPPVETPPLPPVPS